MAESSRRQREQQLNARLRSPSSPHRHQVQHQELHRHRRHGAWSWLLLERCKWKLINNSNSNNSISNRRQSAGTARDDQGSSEEVTALRDKVRLLSAENARLSRELAKIRRLSQQKQQGPSEADLLREEFHKQFGVLKLSMQHFKLVYAEGDRDGVRRRLEKRFYELESKYIASERQRKFFEKQCNKEHQRRNTLELQAHEMRQNIASLEQQLRAGVSSGSAASSSA
ncbi:Hypothetical Protein FCC1311_077232 [Hondaea fermentalgiana]|uniref:Uncharacterized protein n=1 Tax=Hondaea fermentalgiana TaxID=2315210 RepID=A0A2R5GMH0_9STRA|nr:Hypothetical Protein FCC1311_077232 [Hondaea fermentalgiana]|eukprot:GBG31499.1 Hypothetical Protein FCC1311_077232 [Hondaea fermentalgiana]